MSNLLINIRIIYWHFQIDTSLEKSFKINSHWKKYWKSMLLKPVAFYDFKIKMMRMVKEHQA